MEEYMRLRNIPAATDALANSTYCILDVNNRQSYWRKIFGNNNPLYVEIGMGKGQFLIALAEQHPEINYIGMERYDSVLYRALQKMEEHPLPNVRFLCINAEILPEIFAKGEIDHIYLNFSDPWPKDRHAKRRLTSREFLARYNEVLRLDGKIEFKTDNQVLFDFSLAEVDAAGWKLDGVSRDLHHDSIMNKDNVMTEYEEKFSAKGNPIYKLITSR